MPEKANASEQPKRAASGKKKSNGSTEWLDATYAARARKELGDEKIVEIYRLMLLMRRFEEQAGRAYQMGKIKGFCHLYIGQEPVAAACAAALEERDYIVSAYREHGHALAKGMTPNAVMAELFGKVDGCSGGKGGSMHLFDTSIKFYGGWGIVGGQIPTAAGIAFAAKYRDENAVTLGFLGDGSIHQGVVHETFNMAELWDLPVVFIIENNKYAMGTELHRASSVEDLSVKAKAYGMAHAQVDGKDIFKAYYGIKEAVDRARNESRPTLLDVITYRFRGHSMSDPANYRTKEELEAEMAADPILRLQNWMMQQKIRSAEQFEAMDKEVKDEVKASLAFAEQSPQPDVSALERDIYVDWSWDID
ncbi:MAG: pyruvate dehydrogenase (acetyl-transferring) E1 component subunit alpha [bacterium]